MGWGQVQQYLTIHNKINNVDSIASYFKECILYVSCNHIMLSHYNELNGDRICTYSVTKKSLPCMVIVMLHHTQWHTLNFMDLLCQT